MKLYAMSVIANRIKQENIQEVSFIALRYRDNTSNKYYLYAMSGDKYMAFYGRYDNNSRPQVREFVSYKELENKFREQVSKGYKFDIALSQDIAKSCQKTGNGFSPLLVTAELFA
jgi:predicted DNA-binding WGR domain protein